MSIWQMAAALAIVAGLLAMLIGLRMRVRELEEVSDRRDEVLRKAATDLAMTVSRQAEIMEKMDERLKKAEEKLEQLPVEDFTEELRRMQDFNDGAQSIAMFGGDIPKLNKDAVRKR